MKIAINTRHRKKWGGGSHFVTALEEGLIKSGHSVCHGLSRKLNAILVVSNSSNMCFGRKQIEKYLSKYPKTAVFQRINNLDTHAKKGNIKRYKKFNKITTGTIYVSEWAKRYARDKKGLDLRNEFVVVNDVSDSFKHMRDRWDKSMPLKILTHHWSTNVAKGFDVYKKIDNELKSNSKLRSDTEFMYIGRFPEKYKLKHFVVKKSLYKEKLAEKIRSRHVYITASLLECGAYHVMEALRCGLPVMYGPNGGSVGEYVGDCGFCFDPNKPMKRHVDRMMNEYDMYYDRIVKRFENKESMSDQYLRIMKSFL